MGVLKEQHGKPISKKKKAKDHKCPWCKQTMMIGLVIYICKNCGYIANIK